MGLIFKHLNLISGYIQITDEQLVIRSALALIAWMLVNPKHREQSS